MDKMREPKVAVAYSFPLHYPEIGESDVLKKAAQVLTKRGYNLEAVTLGNEARMIESDGFRETTLKRDNTLVKGEGQSDDYRAHVESAVSGFLRNRSAFNSEPAMMRKLEEMKPDIIITANFYIPHAIDIIDVLMEYKAIKGGAPKLVVLSDDRRFIPEFFELDAKTFVKSHQNPQNLDIGVGPYVAEIEKIYTRMMNGADAIVFYTDEDVSIARGRNYPPELFNKIMRIQPANPMEKAETGVRDHLRRAFFYGNSAHPSNAEAKALIVERIAPMVPQSISFVMGGGSVEYHRTLPNVESYDYMPSVDEEMKKCDVYIGPVITGSGIKTKLLAPVRWGIPIISTPLCAEGFPAVHERNMIIEASVERFPYWIGRLADKGVRYELANNAKKDMGDYFSLETVGERWDRLLSRLAGEMHGDVI